MLVRFVIRALLGLAASCGDERAPAWVALDRGAAERLELDREWLVLARRPLAPPCPAGELVARVRGRIGRAPIELVLEPRPQGEGLLWRRSPEGEQVLLASVRDASALAGSLEGIVVGCWSGELSRRTLAGAWLGAIDGPAPVRALAPGPQGTWWRLAGEGELALLAPGLETRWSVCTGLGADGFAPVPGVERVWLAAGSRARAFGPGGQLEQELELSGGPWRVAVAEEGRLVLTSPGALLECAMRGGRMVPIASQGGFRDLHGLAHAEAGAGVP